MQIPDNLYYTKDHEWIEAMNSDTYKLGITDYAQDALGDVVFVEIKEIGTEIAAGEAFGEVESTKSVSDLYMPIPGIVQARNERLTSEPELVNSDPYGDGWMCQIKASLEPQILLEKLLDSKAYAELVAEEN